MERGPHPLASLLGGRLAGAVRGNHRPIVRRGGGQGAGSLPSAGELSHEALADLDRAVHERSYAHRLYGQRPLGPPLSLDSVASEPVSEPASKPALNADLRAHISCCRKTKRLQLEWQVLKGDCFGCPTHVATAMQI